MPPPKVAQWVNENFPKPRVDPEWLDGCCEWLVGNQHIDPLTSFPEFTDQVKDQLLQSDLHDSMMHGTGLDVHINKYTGSLRGPPVLVQITEISDIGISAFQLEQVRAAREERLMAGVGDEEGEEDGDVDVEGEGPMPKYPRGALRFKLSDGVTTLKAIEYRSLPQISLGPTPLGYKLQLKGTLIRNGIAFLEPATVVLLGGAQDQLDARQREEFKNLLRERLGLPIEVEPEAPAPAPAAAPAPAPVAAAARSPLRDISPPPSPPLFPQHDDDMGMGARRRRVPELPSTSTTISASSSRNISGNIQGRPIIGLPRGRKSNTSTTSNDNKHISQSEEPDLDLEIKEGRPSATERNMRTHTAASQNNTTSSHFNKNNSKCYPDDVNMDVENLDFNFSPTTRQFTRLYRPSPSTPADTPLRMQIQQQRQDKSFDFDLLDEVNPDENQPPPQKPSSFAALPPSRDLKGKGRAIPCLGSLSKVDDASSDDYGMLGIDDKDFADADFLENLSRVEMEALTDANEPHVPNAGGVGLSSSFMSMGGSSGSFVVVEGDQKTSSSGSGSGSGSGSATIPSSSSSSKPSDRLEIIEIGSSDDEMLGTGDKENEPVATRHIKRRTEDLDAGVRERGRGLVASQGWNPGSGGARKIGGLGTQSQYQNRNQKESQGLKSRVLVTNSEVIDLSDSDDD